MALLLGSALLFAKVDFFSLQNQMENSTQLHQGKIQEKASSVGKCQALLQWSEMVKQNVSVFLKFILFRKEEIFSLANSYNNLTSCPTKKEQQQQKYIYKKERNKEGSPTIWKCNFSLFSSPDLWLHISGPGRATKLHVLGQHPSDPHLTCLLQIAAEHRASV